MSVLEEQQHNSELICYSKPELWLLRYQSDASEQSYSLVNRIMGVARAAGYIVICR